MPDKNTDKNSLFVPKFTAKKVVLTYILLSILLFVFGDKMIFSLSTDNTTLLGLHTTKNILFILLSAVCLYYLLNLYTKTFLETSAELAAENLGLKKTCEDLQTTAEHYSALKKALTSALPAALFYLNKEGLLLNFEIPESIGLPPKFCLDQAARSQHISALFSEEFSKKNLAVIQKVLTEDTIERLEYRDQENGESTFWEVHYAPYLREEVMVFVRDITAQKRNIENLKQLSIHDKLTGLTNRTFFELQLDRLQGTQHFPVGVIVCEAEYLNLLNDIIGCSSEEKVLLSAAALLKHSFPEAVSISRIGSSQFVIFLKNAFMHEMEIYTDNLKKNVAAYNQENPANPLIFSVGLAISKEPESRIQDLFYEADYAVYCDKTDRRKETGELFLKAILHNLEKHDATAYAHFSNMQQLIEKFARTCDLSLQTIEDLKHLATFHDIGKIGVPSCILSKEAQLNQEELTAVRKHCSIGYRIARVITPLMPIADLINKHHEWWDGHGYPLGLKEEQIPLECRILAIIEAFDVMTTNNPYRAAMPVSAALNEIKRGAGTQFDPDLAEKFLDFIQKEVSG